MRTAEVAYDHVSSERFRHGTKLLRWWPDKRPDSAGWNNSGSRTNKNPASSR